MPSLHPNSLGRVLLSHPLLRLEVVQAALTGQEAPHVQAARVGFGGQAQRLALRLPQVRHDGRQAEPALVAVENLAAARVFQAVQARHGPLNAPLLLRTNRLLKHTPRGALRPSRRLSRSRFASSASIRVGAGADRARPGDPSCLRRLPGR